MHLVLHTTADPLALASALQSVVWALDKEQPLSGVQTLETRINNQEAPVRNITQFSVYFALLALFLAAIGIYGVMAYFVDQRGREIGIRIALGAKPRDVLRLVLGRGLLLTAVGVTIGLVGAAALTRSLATLVFGIAPLDPFSFAAGALLLAAVALAGCYVPARRAMRVDPMVALRYE